MGLCCGFLFVLGIIYLFLRERAVGGREKGRQNPKQALHCQLICHCNSDNDLSQNQESDTHNHLSHPDTPGLFFLNEAYKTFSGLDVDILLLELPGDYWSFCPFVFCNFLYLCCILHF